MLEPSQLPRLEERLRAVEARTGAQVLLAVFDRAEAYHGLRWRAYAFGSSLAGAAAVLAAARLPVGDPARAVLVAVAAVLGTGLAFALAATLVPAFARLFIEPGRAEDAVRRRAQSVFLEHRLFATRGRTAVLLLACGFERRVEILPDLGFEGRVGAAEWEQVRAAATGPLREGRVADALLSGLDALERLLAAKGFAPQAGGANELPDALVTGDGS